MKSLLIDLLLLPVRLALLIAVVLGGWYLYQATDSIWVLGLPVYLSPISWWLSYRRIDREFDPLDWNNPFQSRWMTFLSEATFATLFGGFAAGLLLSMTARLPHFGFLLYPFGASFVLAIARKFKLDRRRKRLSRHFKPNVTAQRIWTAIAIIAWLIGAFGIFVAAGIEVISALGFIAFALGFIAFAIAVIALGYLDENPKKLS